MPVMPNTQSTTNDKKSLAGAGEIFFEIFWLFKLEKNLRRVQVDKIFRGEFELEKFPAARRAKNYNSISACTSAIDLPSGKIFALTISSTSVVAA